MKDTTLDDILFGELRMLQPVDGPRVSVDTVLLSSAVKVRGGEKVIELGCAHGAVLLILAKKFPRAESFEALEICGDLVELAGENAKMNGLQEQTRFKEGDLREVGKLYPRGGFDVVLMNPPYNDPGKSRVSPRSARAIARHGTACTLADVVTAASYLLKPRGRFYVVLRVNRLAETLSLLKRERVEPKRLRFVHPVPGKDASMFLLSAMKEGREGLVVVPPLFITDEHGSYTSDLLAAYRLDASPCL